MYMCKKVQRTAFLRSIFDRLQIILIHFTFESKINTSSTELLSLFWLSGMFCYSDLGKWLPSQIRPTYYQSDKFLPRFLMSTSFLSSLQWLEIRRVIMLAIRDFLSYTYWQTLSYSKWLQCSVLKNSPKFYNAWIVEKLVAYDRSNRYKVRYRCTK